MMWQDDILLTWQDEPDEMDDDEIIPELCWEAASEEEDGKTAEQIYEWSCHKCGMPPKPSEEYQRK